MIDREKGRMRIRTKVCVALAVVISCTAIADYRRAFHGGLELGRHFLSVRYIRQPVRIHGLGRKTFRQNLASDKHIGSGRGD